MSQQLKQPVRQFKQQLLNQLPVLQSRQQPLPLRLYLQPPLHHLWIKRGKGTFIIIVISNCSSLSVSPGKCFWNLFWEGVIFLFRWFHLEWRCYPFQKPSQELWEASLLNRTISFGTDRQTNRRTARDPVNWHTDFKKC